jgi:predicted TIM-barrel fold metal-dependent hydrolase
VIIDFQHHYIPWSLAERHGARRGEKVNMTQAGVAKFTLHDRVYDLDQQVRDLALSGMDVAVLSCPVGWDAPLEDCQLINDEYAAVQDKYPDRFVGLAHVPVHEGKTALRELDLALAATRLIAGGVLDEFPTLKVVVGHFGGGVAAIKERLRAKAYRFGAKRARSFDESFDLLYFDMAGFEGGRAALQCALTGIKPGQLVFATDYPQDFTGQLTDTGKGVADIRRYIQDIRDLDLPPAATEAMLGGTAAQLLKSAKKMGAAEARRPSG